SFDLSSSVLAPLEPHKQNIIVVDGLENQVCQEGYGHTHSRGMAAFLTGQPLLPGNIETQDKGVGNVAGFADRPSLDQVLGRTMGGNRKFASLQLGVHWRAVSDPDFPAVAPYSIVSYEGSSKPVAPATDPQAVFSRLFGSALPSGEQMKDRSILDLVD